MRRSKVTNVYEASIPLTCRKEGCGAEFFIAPAKLEKDESAACPKCAGVQHFTSNDVLRLRSENVARLNAAVEEMRKR
jgi:hypothetical protein